MRTVLCFMLALMLAASSAFAGQIVATTSDYESGNTALYDTATGAFDAAALGQDDQDIAAVTDGEYVYFLSRSLGAVSKYDPAGIGGGENNGLIWQYSVGPTSNPYDIVFLDSKAYVVRYGSAELMIVDTDAADEASFELGAIDLSAFDENGVPEVVGGFVYDGMVYVVLQRLNGWTAEVPGYIVKIDPATDTVVDLDADTEGVQGIELMVMNPQSISLVGGTAYIGGHVWGVQTEGVQSVDLTNPAYAQAMVLDEETMAMDITGMKVFSDDQGIFYSSAWVEEGETWVQVAAAYWFNPSDGAMGEALPVPTPDGGAVTVNGIVYVGSRDAAAPGIYPVNPATNALAGEAMISSLPPTSIVFAGEEGPIAVAEEVAPASFSLDAPYPNPFNPSTTISFSLAEAGATTIDIFNIAGQRVDTLLNGQMAAGSHSVVWNAEKMSNGVYFVRVSHGHSTHTAKVMLVK